jgi:ABC-type nitrate/sulfonate/bicarbonate transport system ATPase subunit
MSVPVLQLKGVTQRFGAVDVLADLSLTVASGEFLAIVGPSGSGKTTLLSLLSGFLAPTSGTITRTGRTRTVYQSDGLFPWLTVRKNIALGAPVGPDRERQIDALIQLIGLEAFAGAYPHQLSGGMRQRVEIARALCGDTDILLLDEPFSALDYLTRLKMRAELVRLLAERPRTVVLVTHDIEEAAQLADRVLVLSDRPARVHQELCIPLPRPREITSPGVVAAIHELLSALGVER